MHLAGLDIIAHELGELRKRNSELEQENQLLEQRIQVLEDIISSYSISASGNNNRVLP